MMKIVHIISGLNTGGAEMMLYKVLSRTDRRRFDAAVISLTGSGNLGERIKDLDIPVLDASMKRGQVSPEGLRRLIAAVRRLEPDILQGWMYHGNLAALLAASFLRSRKPVVWNIRQSLYSLSHEKRTTAVVIKLGGYLSRFPAAIIYNSVMSAGQHKALGYRADAQIFIPNGFDTDQFAPSLEARASVRQELGLKDDAFLIGLVGRYHPMKDHANFLKAALLICDNNENVQCILVGHEIDGNNEQLCVEIERLRIKERVHLLGERKDTPRLTAAFDIAVSSSSHGEGFPNVIGEAMSCAVPCVVTNVGDSASIVGDTGIVVPPRNAEALAEAISQLVEAGENKRKELGMKARRRIIENYSIEQVVKQYENLYTSFIKNEY